MVKKEESLKQIIVNNEIWQKQIALVENGSLIGVDFEFQDDNSIEKSFFKGKVVRILPGIQTAFVDIGQEKAGFLHITEIENSAVIEQIAQEELDGEELSEKKASPARVPRKKGDIKKLFTVGQEFLVQVIKEPMGSKGAKLSTCFALPGRFLVLTPNICHLGVSRKIESRTERARLKAIIEPLLDNNCGVIVRTTAANLGEDELIADYKYLSGLWSEIESKFKNAAPGEMIHKDLPMSLRFIRENLSNEIDQIICNDPSDVKEIASLVERFLPEKKSIVKLFDKKTPIFQHFGITKQIEELYSKRVYLKSGATLIIETTEAMTVVDVNTGKFVGEESMEETMVKTNMEAASEVVRQIILRNIGGLIVIDFIDMSSSANKNKVYKHLEKLLLEKDRLKAVALRISEFGIVQMTRKRSGKSIIKQFFQECKSCCGLGFVKSIRTRSFNMLSAVAEKVVVSRKKTECIVSVPEEVFHYLSQDKSLAVMKLSEKLGVKIVLQMSKELNDDDFIIS